VDSLELINKLEKNNVFLTGGAGVGKSFLTKKLMYQYEGNCIVVAPTGIAAVNIQGQTIHSFFEFSRNLSKFNKLTYPKKKLLSQLDLLIIDEISMVSMKLFDAINKRLIEASFKGKILIVGDFYQLPPVNVEQEGWAFESIWWKYWNFEMVELTKIKRTNHKLFSAILNRLRDATFEKEDIEFIFNLKNNKYLAKRNLTFLYSTNKKVNEKNSLKLLEIDSKLIIFTTESELFYEEKKTQFENFKKSLNINENFEIKKGAVVLNMVNQRFEDGDVLYNGEKGVVVDIDEKNEIIKVDFENRGIILIERHSFDFIEYDYDVVNDKITQHIIGSVYQFPLKLAYAITIHKSQGLSIDNLAIDLSYIFSPAQGYVALSRAINPDNVVINPPKRKPLKDVFYIDDKVKEFYQNIKK
jgi:ATP-dependent exoDNAse (exonuclease V) alpha subunit